MGNNIRTVLFFLLYSSVPIVPSIRKKYNQRNAIAVMYNYIPPHALMFYDV